MMTKGIFSWGANIELPMSVRGRNNASIDEFKKNNPDATPSPVEGTIR